MKEQKKIVIRWQIDLPMEFPQDWDKELIEFHLNDSSWCCDNLIDELEKFSDEYGCICSICRAKVADGTRLSIKRKL